MQEVCAVKLTRLESFSWEWAGQKTTHTSELSWEIEMPTDRLPAPQPDRRLDIYV